MAAPTTSFVPVTLDDAVVTLVGDVGALEIRRAAFEIEGRAGPSHVVLDLNGVRSIELSAVDPLLDTLQAVREQGVEVRVAPLWAHAVFRLTGRWHPDW